MLKINSQQSRCIYEYSIQEKKTAGRFLKR